MLASFKNTSHLWQPSTSSNDNSCLKKSRCLSSEFQKAECMHGSAKLRITRRKEGVASGRKDGEWKEGRMKEGTNWRWRPRISWRRVKKKR